MEYITFFKDNMNKALKQQFIKAIDNLITDKNFTNTLQLKNSFNFTKVIFSIGGDGTFLSATNKFGFDDILYIPINNGTLGFYTSWNINTLNFANFSTSHINTLPLINVNIDKENYLCVNESTLINPTQTQILDIYINEMRFESFRGTGICLSTPSGSTGYNKSLQGSLFDPTNKLFQLTKIAPINNNKYRTIANSLIFNSCDIIKVKFLEQSNHHSIITIDRENFKLNTNELTFSLSNKQLLVLSSDYHFWNRIKNNFLLDK
ncbi:MAG: NAD(+)/NADH kinase [Mycoplasmatales bacterium]